MKPKARRTFHVGREEAGMRLLSYLKSKLSPSYSAKMVKRAIDRHACMVNGKSESFSTYRVTFRDRVEFNESRMLKLTSCEMQKICILYENEELLIISKPGGVTSDNGEIKNHLPIKYPYLELVHRLDRNTSGVLVLAKTPRARREMEDLFRNREIEKEYLAIVDGSPKKPKGSIENYLGKVSTWEGQSLFGAVPESEGRYALTEYKTLATGVGLSLLKVSPQTGRTHQIRTHLKSIGTPILGDYQYARSFRSSFEVSRQMLHAHKLSFTFQGEKIYVTAPLTREMRELINEIYQVSDC
ncbi:MAG: RluA family pseudouridine synthase [Candidatus Algichlamydia australiensis]|nr:RluA family pseudouridine synthase [Chlamydiales bacterium]